MIGGKIKFPQFILNELKKVGPKPGPSCFEKLYVFDFKKEIQVWCPARDLNPYACALDPKSSVSANFTSWAFLIGVIFTSFENN